MLLLEAARQFDDGSRRILDCAKMSNLAAPPSLGDSNRNRVFVDVQADECVDLRHEPFSWKTSPAGSQGLHNWTASAAAKKGHCHLDPSPARTIGLQNTADHPCQGEWVRIAACHHALYGQVVRVLHREWHDGVQLVVEGPDGKRCRLPLTWTDAAAEACLPTLLFAPGALRALVRLVRSHRSSAPQQACHASQQPDAAVEQLPGRNARSDDLALGRSPAPLAGEPRAPRGDAA